MVFGRKKKSTSQDKIVTDSAEPVESQFTDSNDPLEPPPPKSCGAKVVLALRKNILLILTVASVSFGIGLGFLLRATTNLSPKVIPYFGYPGELFLRGLKFIILPLVASSLICGISGLGLQKTGTLCFFISFLKINRK